MYKILVDSGCDLTADFLKANDIGLVNLSYSVDGVEYIDKADDTDAVISLYNKMKEGKLTSTSQPLQEDIYQQFKLYAEQGVSVVYVTLSSGISGTYDSACMARNRCKEEYPSAEVEVVDSLAASGGYGLLIRHAVEERAKGMPFADMCEWLKVHSHHVVHWFTVDDLEYLHRGGRVSRTVAVVGGVLKLKPVMRVDEGGHLVSNNIARGRKNALRELVNNIIESCKKYAEGIEQTVCIHHADCPEDAALCKKLLEESGVAKKVIVEYIGPTIGCHSGPGTIAVFCFGNTREKEKS